MKKVVLFTFMVAMISQSYAQLNFNGHVQTTVIPYAASPYSYPPKMLQLAGSGTASNKIFEGYAADNFVNFTYDTFGKSVYMVYTTNGTNPSKTNGTSTTCSFSTYTNPDRLFQCQVPSSANTVGTTVKYIFYISNSTLAAGYARVDGYNGNQYLTSWSESNVVPYEYTVLAASLPVELVSFTAATENAVVHLNWETSAEVNSSHFEVERSVDAQNFETIGKVAAAGQSATNRNYTFTDVLPASGTNYYRLKQVDLDGSVHLSRLVSISVANDSRPQVLAFPNPVSNQLTVRNVRAGSRLDIYTTAGVFLKTYVAEGNEFTLPTENLTKGMLLLKVTQPDGEVSNTKFFLQ